jgi:catechol 2,3-dioxygenase
MCQFHLPTHTQLTELHFRTRSLDRAVRFYTELLGFQVVERSEFSAALAARSDASPLIRFSLDRDARKRQPNETGLDRFGIRFPTLGDLASVARRIANHDSPFAGESISVHDPDENTIELYYDGLSTDTHIGYVHFIGKNRNSAERFFAEYLGFENTSNLDDSLSFTIGEAAQRIDMTERKDASRHAHNNAGLISYKISVQCGELLYALNQRAGVFGFGCAPAAYSPRVLRIPDPFGFALEVETVDFESANQRNSAEGRNELSLSTKSGWRTLFHISRKSF